MSICGKCGMPVEDGPHYHPYAACLMFKQTHSSAQVEANLAAVAKHGAAAEGARIREGLLAEISKLFSYEAHITEDDLRGIVLRICQEPA